MRLSKRRATNSLDCPINENIIVDLYVNSKPGEPVVYYTGEFLDNSILGEFFWKEAISGAADLVQRRLGVARILSGNSIHDNQYIAIKRLERDKCPVKPRFPTTKKKSKEEKQQDLKIENNVTA